MKKYFLLVICIVYAAGMGFLSGCGAKDEHSHDNGGEHEGHEHAEEWQVTGDQKSSEGHDSHDEGEHGDDVIEVSSHYKELLGLKTDKVALRNLKKTITIIGEISRDFEKPVHVTSDISGKVIKLNAHLGDHHMKAGETLAVIEGEDGQIREITSPMGCMIIGEHVDEGEEVSADTSLFTMADMSNLKASFDVYQEDMAHIRKGQKMKVESSVYPGKMYPAKITFISPLVDGKTRAVKIRVDINNFDCSLKLGMFIKGYVTHTNPIGSLTVPGSAVQTWDGKKVVFISEGNNKYRIRNVKIGSGEGEYIEVVAGLNAGDEVVSDGSFHLKSELRRRSAGDAGHGHAH